MDSATFRLYRLAQSAGPAEPPKLLGVYGSRAAALAARDVDVLACLERAGGRRVELTHEIHSCREGASCSSQLLACAVGQPIGWPVDVRSELAATASWLHRRATHGP